MVTWLPRLMPSQRMVKLSEDTWNLLMRIMAEKINREMRRPTMTSIIHEALTLLLEKYKGQSSSQSPQQQQAASEDGTPSFVATFLTEGAILRDVIVEALPEVDFHRAGDKLYAVAYNGFGLDIYRVTFDKESQTAITYKRVATAADFDKWMEECNQELKQFTCESLKSKLDTIRENRRNLNRIVRFGAMLQDFLTLFTLEDIQKKMSEHPDVARAIVDEMSSRWYIKYPREKYESEPWDIVRRMANLLSSFIQDKGNSIWRMYSSLSENAEEIAKCGLRLCPPDYDEERAKQEGCYLTVRSLLKACEEKEKKESQS